MSRKPPGQAVEEIAVLIRHRLKELGLSPFQAARRTGLPDDAIKSVLKGSSPSIDRAAEIADALGFEFYIGPPRSSPHEPENLNKPGLHSDSGTIDDYMLTGLLTNLMEDWKASNAHGRQKLLGALRPHIAVSNAKEQSTELVVWVADLVGDSSIA